MLEVSHKIVQDIANMPTNHSWAAKYMRVPVEFAEETEARLERAIVNKVKELYPESVEADRLVRNSWLFLLEYEAIEMYADMHPNIYIPVVSSPSAAVSLAEADMMYASIDDKIAAEEFLTMLLDGEISLEAIDMAPDGCTGRLDMNGNPEDPFLFHIKEEANVTLYPNEIAQLIKDDSKSDVETFAIGEPFSWKEYAYRGDHINPVLNEEGFDVVVSLTNINQDEYNAFCNADVTIALYKSELAPLFAISFEGKLYVDFSLNILKMKEIYRKLWMSSKENEAAIRLFLLEGETSKLRAIRYLVFDDMQYLRKICMPQVGKSIREVDNAIKDVTNLFGIMDIIRNASRTYRFKK